MNRGAGGASPLRRWGPWVALGASILAFAAVAGGGSGDGAPLDPSSTGASGTKALVDTLRELGADVTVQSGAPDRQATTALLLVDRLDDAMRDEVTRWTAAGGTLVVTDASSPFNRGGPAGSAAFAFVEPELRRNCDEPALRGVERVHSPGAVLLEVPAGATGCFTSGEHAWLVIMPMGEGTVVALGGAGAFTNVRLGRADNAALAAALLAPGEGDRVAVLRPPQPGSGERSLLDLVSPNVKLALAQLAVAFVLVALWRARRLGRPVLEPQPVQVAGSELVVAVGELLQRSRARAQAGSILREGAAAAVATRLGLPRHTEPRQVAEAAAARTGRPAEKISEVLAGEDPVDEDSLVALAQAVESLRAEVGR